MQFTTKPMVKTLDLRAPLAYASADAVSPFDLDPSLGWIARYSLPGELGLALEPDPGAYLGTLVFVGISPESAPAESAVSIPVGLYLFAQAREAPSPGVVFALALEAQREALWRSMNPAGSLYVRCLVEDGGPVTQCFRPLVPSLPGKA